MVTHFDTQCTTVLLYSPVCLLVHILQRGQELLRTYLTRLHGIAGLVQYYDAYFAVQEWKKLQTGAEGFETKALNILEVSHHPLAPVGAVCQRDCGLCNGGLCVVAMVFQSVVQSVHSNLILYHIDGLTTYLSLCAQLYLLKDSARRLELSFLEAEQMVDTLNTVKHKEHTGTCSV
jgi:hypothetical protein